MDFPSLLGYAILRRAAVEPDPVAADLPSLGKPGKDKGVKILVSRSVNRKTFVVIVVEQPVQGILSAWHFLAPNFSGRD